MIFRDNAPALAEMGYFVFPLRGKSEHLLPNGCNGASNDLNQVKQWAAQYPDANIGIKCENLLVIDLDIGDEKDGPADFLKVAGSLGMLPSGPESVTGSGGNHLLLQKPAVDVIGQTGVKWNGRKTGIDIRIGNQYIVAPPSIHPNGKPYQWARPVVPVEELPEIPQAWIDGFLPIRGKQSPPPEPPPYTPGKNNAVDRCRPYVEKVEPSVAGQNGDTQLYKAACVIFWDFGLSESEGMPLLQEFNVRSQPPWPQNRLDYKMQQALDPGNHDTARGHKLADDSPKMSWSEHHRRQGKYREPETEQKPSEPEKKIFPSVAHSTVFDDWYLGLTDGKPLVRYLVADESDDLNLLAWEPEVITTIGAPPGSGKSALANQLVFEGLYRNPDVTAFIANVEQSTPSLLNRELSRVADLPYDLIRYKRLNEIHRQDRLEDGIEKIRQVNDRLHWMKHPMTIERIVAEVRRVDATLVLVDYVQKIYSEASISSDYERINFIMSQLIELKSEGRCIVAISALSRQTTKAGAYTSINMGSFRGSSDLEFSSTNAFILEKSDDARYNRFLKCFKMKDDAPVSMKMVFRGSRMRFDVVGTVSDDEDFERPGGVENGNSTPGCSEWDAGGCGDEPVEEVGFAV